MITPKEWGIIRYLAVVNFGIAFAVPFGLFSDGADILHAYPWVVGIVLFIWSADLRKKHKMEARR